MVDAPVAPTSITFERAVQVSRKDAARSFPQAQMMATGWPDRWALLRREVVVALPFGLALLPICLSSGLLAFAPLGPDYVAKGITAALYAIIFGGIIATLFATSSFVVYSPRSNLALVQATAAVYFLGKASFAGNPAAVVVAMAACVMLAGLFQILFAAVGVARIIRYTPHPVMAGFINGAALSIAWSQLKPFIESTRASPDCFPLLQGRRPSPSSFFWRPSSLA